MGRLKRGCSLSYLRHHVVVIMIVVVSLWTFAAVLLLYKSSELHARRPPWTKYHNLPATKLFQEEFFAGRDGIRIGSDGNLTEGKHYEKEGRELLKELTRIAMLQQSNVSDSKKIACMVPELNPFDESIIEHIREPVPLNCEGIMLTDVKNKQLVLRTVLSRKYKTCYVSTINRASDFSSLVSSPMKVHVDYQRHSKSEDIPLRYNLSSDFTAVICMDSNISDSKFNAFHKNNPQLFDLHASVVPRPGVLQRLRNIKPPNDGLVVNVIMLGIESTSRMNFIRQLPRTTEFLAELGSIVLEKYNIVADGTLGAFIPMLTGRTEYELPEVQKYKRLHKWVDTYPMIWKEFAKSGYATMYAGNSRPDATFNGRLSGFEAQPTDHYMRTFWNSAPVKDHCLGPHPVHRVTLNYLYDYMTEYKDKPHFALTFLGELTHDNINPLRLMDDNLYWFFTSVHNQGLLNNTIIFIFGDHGSRYSAIRKTLQGKLEERLPYMSITLPDWMPKRHPNVVKNLLMNIKRLVTPFDIHETLRSVLHYNTTPAVSVKQRGISLFHEIPTERTCDHAHVAPHWCSCMTWEPASEDSLGHLSSAVIDDINAKTEPVRHMCAKLRLAHTLHAEMVQTKKVLRFVSTDGVQRGAALGDKSTVRVAELPVLYQVTVETLPGNGLFEGTVRVLLPKSKNDSIVYQSTGDISRVNMYGKQADCIRRSRPNLLRFCYCKDNKKQGL